MLDLILQILSILGIILLVLLVLFLTVILLVLFFPVTYRIRGSKDENGLRVSAKAKWLFGLLRVNYCYPESKSVVVKGLWFTLFDSASQGKGNTGEKAGKSIKKKAKGKKPGNKKGNTKEDSHIADDKDATGKAASEEKVAMVQEKQDNNSADSDSASGCSADTENTDTGYSAEAGNESHAESTPGILGKFFQKFAKIKYTICSIYDKIKKIWENISYYLELVQEDDTKQLFSDVMQKILRILKNIRPRHIKADILFGTGSTDTTGYIYGTYCMLAAVLGSGFWLTPDFEQAVFKGEFDVSGHATIGVLLVNGLKLLLDKKLQRFIKKLKNGKTNNENKVA